MLISAEHLDVDCAGILACCPEMFVSARLWEPCECEGAPVGQDGEVSLAYLQTNVKNRNCPGARRDVL